MATSFGSAAGVCAGAAAAGVCEGADGAGAIGAEAGGKDAGGGGGGLAGGGVCACVDKVNPARQRKAIAKMNLRLTLRLIIVCPRIVVGVVIKP